MPLVTAEYSRTVRARCVSLQYGRHLLQRSRRRSTKSIPTVTAAVGSGRCFAVAISGSMRAATGEGSFASAW
jgi:hypothetical protein